MTLNLRRRLREQEPLLAAFSIIPSREIVELIALAGFDAVILDMEHGPYGIDSLGPLVLAAQARGMYPIARVQRNDPSLIGAALDVGAAGVLVPQVASASDALAAVNAAPLGKGGRLQRPLKLVRRCQRRGSRHRHDRRPGRSRGSGPDSPDAVA